jgi:RNA polymerase sigma-70 factor (ECF subfamily)
MLQPSTTGTIHNGQSPDPAEGWRLVAAAQQGDRIAFGQLYERYANPVSRVVMARTGDRDLTDDLTSETFARALHRIDAVNNQGRDVGGWLKTIARNMTVDHFRSSRYQREQTTSEIADTPASDAGPEQAVIEKETTAELRRHIAQLPPAQQECLQLRFWEGLSSKETAAAMGRDDGAVRGLRHRAITGLRASLSGNDSPDPLAGASRSIAEVAEQVAGGGPVNEPGKDIP